MEIILSTNRLGKVRRQTLNGRAYLVAPAVLIRYQVLKGSQGPLLYREEDNHSPADWNGMPIVAFHPVKNGAHVSARDPEVIEEQGMGHVYRTHNQGKLGSEMWFDEELTKARDRQFGTDVHGKLLRNEAIEISTGVFTKNRLAPAGSTHNGVPYVAVATNWKPDHVAVLDGEVGACSVRDGCGAVMNQLRAELQEQPRPKVKPVANKSGLFERFLNWLSANSGEAGSNPLSTSEGYADLGHTPESQVHHPKTGTFLGKVKNAAQRGFKPSPDQTGEVGVKRGAKAGIEDDDDAFPTDPAESEDQDEVENQQATSNDGGANMFPGQAGGGSPFGGGGGPPDKHAATKGAAKATVDSDHEPAAEPAMGAVQASKAGNSKKAAGMHGKAAEAHEDAATSERKKGNEDGAMAHDNAAALHRKAASLHSAAMNQQSNNNSNPGGNMFDREKTIEYIVANCDCEDQVADRKVLNKLSDKRLQRMRTLLEATVNGTPRELAFNAESGKYAINKESASSTAEEGDKDEDEPERDEENEGNPGPGLKGKKVEKVSGNAKHWADVFAAAPPEIQEAVQNAVALTNNTRRTLLQRLAANVKATIQGAAEQKRIMAAFADPKRYSLKALQDQVAMIPVAANRRGDRDDDRERDAIPNFLGAASADAVGNRRGGEADKNDILTIPTMDFGQPQGIRRQG